MATSTTMQDSPGPLSVHETEDDDEYEDLSVDEGDEVLLHADEHRRLLAAAGIGLPRRSRWKI